MPGVGLVLNTVSAPSDDAVERAAFLGIVEARTDARGDRDFVVLLDLGLKPVKGCFGARRRKVIAMD